MASFSLRMLSVFLTAAFLLNISNYLFIRIYSPHVRNPYKSYKPQKEIRAAEIRRSLNPQYWSSGVECEDKIPSPMTRQSNNSNTSSRETEQSSSAYELIYEKTKTFNDKEDEELENCPELPPGLGPELEDKILMTKNLHTFEAKTSDVRPGGIYQPTACKPLHSVAIIIAYRGCKSFLNTFMDLLHPFLIKQQLDYQIFVIEQSNKTQAFNRGKLLNVGFQEALKSRKNGFSCIILHEPHIVPMDSRNLYRCSWYPRQLATLVERPVKPSYVPLLGGAIALTPEQFLKFNGFSNAYWGNDADYYDLYYRINASNYYIENTFTHVGKYKTIRKGLGLWDKSEQLTTPHPLYLLDGLSSLTYTVDNLELKPLFTYMQVNIDTVPEVKMQQKVLNSMTYKTTPSMMSYKSNINI